jgi:hypothetical protein
MCIFHGALLYDMHGFVHQGSFEVLWYISETASALLFNCPRNIQYICACLFVN